MMAAIYADNLSRSEPSKGIAGRGAAMQAVDQDRTSALCYYCDQLGHFKGRCPLRIKHQRQQRQQPVRHHQQHQHGRRQNNGGEQERRFHRNTTKSASRDHAALAAKKSRLAVVRFHRRHARRQLLLARRHGAGCAELHFRSISASTRPSER